MVSKSTGRKPDRRFLFEQRRHPCFELLHDAALRVVVEEELPWRGETCEQLGILSRGEWNAVTEGFDPLVRRLGDERQGGWRGGEKAPALHDVAIVT